MTKQFVKNDGNLSLVNGGYLVVNGENPVTNADFVLAQQRAEYVVTFAKLAKGKNFVSNKVDSLQDLQREVSETIAKNKPTVFVTMPVATETPITDKLKAEALSFMNFQEGSSKAQKVNKFLQEFTVLSEFEEFGLFFDEGVVKLNQIYTLKEVVDAVSETVDLLNK